MKKNIAIASAAILLATASCKENSKDNTPAENNVLEASVQNASWLIGNWGNTLPDGSFIENWRKVNEIQFNGESYFIVNKDTVFAETVVLRQVDGGVAYTVTVPGQNNEKPVSFKLTSMSGNKLVFENPQHDYPSKIEYTKITADSIVAVIYGTKKGKQASETFAMARLK